MTGRRPPPAALLADAKLVLVLLERLPLELRVDLAGLRIRAEGPAEQQDVRLRAVDGVVLPAPRLLDADAPPLRFAQEALLGEGCTMDPSVFCWIAHCPATMHAEGGTKGEAKGEAKGGALGGGSVGSTSAKKGVGSNFGVPHRDFTVLQSLTKEGKPAVLSVWLPLNNVSVENGCMMVVPKALDAHFHK